MKKRIVNFIDLLFSPVLFSKVALLLILFINFPLVGGWIRVLYKLIPIWAMVIILKNIKSIVACIVQRKYFFLFLMGISYGITIVLNYKFNLISNTKALIWYMIYVGIFFLAAQYSRWNEKDVEGLCRITIISNLFNVIPSLLLLFMDMVIINATNEPMGPVALMGRLYGIVNGVNESAIISAVSIFCSIYLLRKQKKKFIKILYVLTICASYLYIIATGTRSVLYALIIAALILPYYFVEEKFLKRITNKVIKYLSSLGVFVLILFISLAIVSVSKMVVSFSWGIIPLDETVKTAIVENINNIFDLKTEFVSNIGETENATETPEFERATESEISSNQNRLTIWKECIELWKEHKLFGIGSSNMKIYCDLSEIKFEAINIGTVGASTHGTLIAVLLYSGITGLCLFAFMIVQLGLSTVGFLFFNRSNDRNSVYAVLVLFCSCVLILIHSVFATCILFSNIQSTILFWIFLGIVEGYKANRIGDTYNGI